MIKLTCGRALSFVLVSVLVSSLWCVEAQADGFRTWTNRDGRTVRAAFVGLEDGVVNMTLLNGKSAAVPLEKLSEADQQWVNAQIDMAAKPEVPKTDEVPPIPPMPKPKEKVIDWEGLIDLGDRVPELPVIPEPDPNALIPVADWIGGRYFYMRPDGSDAFPHLMITNRVEAFSEGLAWIRTKDHSGYIDREGHWVIGGDSGVPLPEGASDFQSFSEGLAQFGKGKFRGFIDTEGKVVVPADRYYMVEDFSDGLAAVNDSTEHGKQNWCFIHRSGEVAIPGPWPKVLSFSSGVAWVCLDPDYSVNTNGRYQLIDRSGKRIFGDGVFMGNTITRRSVGGYCIAGSRVYRTDGSVAFEEANDYYISDISKDGLLGLANIRGGRGFRIVHLPSKSVCGPVITGYSRGSFEEGLVSASVDGQGKNRYVSYDRSGRQVYGDAFFDPPKFENGYAVVRKSFGPEPSDTRVVVIDRKGKIIWKGEARK